MFPRRHKKCTRDGEDNQECVVVDRRRFRSVALRDTTTLLLRSLRRCCSFRLVWGCGVEDIVLCVESTPSRFHFDFEKRDQSSRRFVLTSSPLSLSLSNDAKKKTVCCIGAGYVGGPTMAMIALKCPHIEVESVSSFSRVSSSSSSSISLLAGFVSKGGVRSTARVAPFVRLFRRHHERGREKSETKDFHRPTRESKTTTKREKSFVEWVALSLSFARM